MGSTVATSSDCVEAFWDQSLFRRQTTSDATVVLPAPGGPAKPMMYLQIVETDLILDKKS